MRTVIRPKLTRKSRAEYPAPVPHKYFTVEDIATYVHHRGPTTLPGVPPDVARGETIVCLHGIGGNGAVFDPLMDRLARDHSPLAFDQPGHGRSGALDSLGSIEAMSEFTRAFLEKLELDPVVLLGHSMGGAVTLEHALRYPRKVRALVLCSSGARFDIAHEVLNLHRRVSEGKERRPFSRDLFSSAASTAALRQGFMEDMKTDPRARYGDLRACSAWSAADKVDSIDLSCLIMVGGDEQPGVSEQADLLASRIPRAHKVVVPKAGHMLPLEAPEALGDAICSFLRELSS
jgi:pimeloyl-ACP methyl ester carboxylesterase